MRVIQRIALTALAWLATISAAHATDVRVTLTGGRVSIGAKDATVGEILAEWARVGQAEIVNLDALPRDRVTIELLDVTEDYALGVLLRGAGGYVARRRPATASDVSLFDRLLIVPQRMVKTAPASPAAPRAAATPDDDSAADEPVAAAASADDPSSNHAVEETPARDGKSRRGPAAVLADGTPVFPPNAGAGDEPPAALGLTSEQPPAVPQSAPLLSRGARSATGHEPPQRAMASGVAAARRAEAPARDQAAVKTAPAADTSWMDQEAPGPPAVPEIPPEDPAAQEAFKRRQATEVLDPRNFKMPSAAPAAPPKGPGRD